ncbi:MULTISPECIES: riboflavin synthase subunit beta [Flavobacterium]|uniref:Riboflavin synthase subunit beta n=1 Tax=Flavobacterium jumunjinense TaxID=998845 RepID=A0ABV5GKD9_9FLAO|nr:MULTISPECIES: riboflavin synthase subunit beta [Flavobacterium]
MGLIGKRKNKKYNYQPRYFDNNGEGSPFEIKHKFDEYRVTVGSDKGLKVKFVKALNDFKYNQNREANRRILIIIGVLLLVFLFIIDFDLSIFKKK